MASSELNSNETSVSLTKIHQVAMLTVRPPSLSSSDPSQAEQSGIQLQDQPLLASTTPPVPLPAPRKPRRTKIKWYKPGDLVVHQPVGIFTRERQGRDSLKKVLEELHGPPDPPKRCRQGHSLKDLFCPPTTRYGPGPFTIHIENGYIFVEDVQETMKWQADREAKWAAARLLKQASSASASQLPALGAKQGPQAPAKKSKPTTSAPKKKAPSKSEKTTTAAKKKAIK